MLTNIVHQMKVFALKVLGLVTLITVASGLTIWRLVRGLKR
jgi:hypothetical protein